MLVNNSSPFTGFISVHEKDPCSVGFSLNISRESEGLASSRCSMAELILYCTYLRRKILYGVTELNKCIIKAKASEIVKGNVKLD